MAKIFFTYEQQLNKLQQEKDLIIPDTDAAKLTLEKLSYYSLIGGYNIVAQLSRQKSEIFIMN